MTLPLPIQQAIHSAVLQQSKQRTDSIDASQVRAALPQNLDLDLDACIHAEIVRAARLIVPAWIEVHRGGNTYWMRPKQQRRRYEARM